MSDNNLAGNVILTHMEEIPLLALTSGTQQTLILVSEPGVGKTSIAATIAELNGDKWRKKGEHYPEDKYCYIILEGPSLDSQAFGSAMPVLETKTIEMFVGGLLQPLDPRPKVIVIDEYGKCPKLLKPTLRDLALERAVGGHRLPEGSIVVATSNNPGDGLGDVLAGHEGNAVTVMYTLKSRKHWLYHWAPAHGVSAITQTAVEMTEQFFDSYMEKDVSDNPFVFDPAKRQLSFVSPRSLTKNDFAFVQNRHLLKRDVLLAAMAGTVGRAAAEIIMTVIDAENDVPKFEDVIASPDTVPVPKTAAGRIFTIFNTASRLVTQDYLAAFLKYVQRWNAPELESTYVHVLMNNSVTKDMASRNPLIIQWMQRDENFRQF